MNRIFLAFIALVLFSCKTPVQEIKEEKEDPAREQFIRANRYMQRRHQDHISAFVERLGWEATTTPSGLWIILEEEGSGPRITTGMQISYTYKLSLLDGTPCYEAGADDPKRITVGQGGVESGVEEGILHLREGSKATLVIPPHLAHGNFGDREKIPGNTIILYSLEILFLHNNLP